MNSQKESRPLPVFLHLQTVWTPADDSLALGPVPRTTCHAAPSEISDTTQPLF